MELVNPTPLPGIAFRQFDQNGDLDCVVSLRGTFEHVQDGIARWIDEQMPLQWQDAYAGDPHTTPMLHQGDLVPEKIGTDVTFLGGSFAPGGQAARWRCGLQLGPIDKLLHVSGRRTWQPVLQRGARWPFYGKPRVTDFELSDSEPTDSVSMGWEQAAGGIPAFGDGAPDPMNPLGCGRVGDEADWQDRMVPAPQISAVSDPEVDAAPAGLAPIPPFWPQRAQYAGTYDETWEADRHPLLPEDFDPRFWQCAPEDQIAQPFLRGDETYLLTNLHREYPEARGQLPGMGLSVRQDDGPWLPLSLDGVQFDWRDGAGRILMTWRARFPLPDPHGVKLHIAWRRRPHEHPQGRLYRRAGLPRPLDHQPPP